MERASNPASPLRRGTPVLPGARALTILTLFGLSLQAGVAGGKARRPAGLAWIRLPGGSFLMGSNRGHHAGPAHRVKVRTFRITRTEVTVDQYRACLKSGACTDTLLTGITRPGQPVRTSPLCNWNHVSRGRHPMNCVDRNQARAFCRWVGGRLPAEAEWEYAARSGGRARRFPWGDELASCRRAVMEERRPGCGTGSTHPVCSRPTGASRQKVCDLSGNVWEWVEDCWHPGYAGAPGDGKPWTRSCEGEHFVVRGGAFNSGAAALQAHFRMNEHPGAHLHLLGFRCAR